MFKNRRSFIIFVVLVMTALAGCAQAETTPQATTAAATDVTVQLSWVHTMEYSGFYMAQDKNHYSAAGLNVELLSGGFDAEGNFISSTDKVLSSEAQFGIINSDLLLIARSNGQPLVAIAAIYQRSPIVLMSLAEKNILKPQDLVGKTVAIDLASATGISFRALLAAENIAEDSITIVPRTGAGNEQLINGDVDVLDGFITNQPVALNAEGYELNLILASDYGIDTYSNVIFTTEDMIAQQPALVESFLRATLNGFSDAVAEPEAAAQLAVQYNSELALESETAGMNISTPLINPAGSQVGMMSSEVWEFNHQLLVDAGVLAEPLEVNLAYDLTFLNKIYSN